MNQQIQMDVNMLDTSGMRMNLHEFSTMFNSNMCPVVMDEEGNDSAIYRIGLPEDSFRQLPRAPCYDR